jgi:hypothetical protein
MVERSRSAQKAVFAFAFQNERRIKTCIKVKSRDSDPQQSKKSGPNLNRREKPDPHQGYANLYHCRLFSLLLQTNKSLFGLLLCTAVLIGWDPETLPPSPPAFGLLYEGAIGQPKVDDISSYPLVADLTKQLCAAPLIPMLETVHWVTVHKTVVKHVESWVNSSSGTSS